MNARSRTVPRGPLRPQGPLALLALLGPGSRLLPTGLLVVCAACAACGRPELTAQEAEPDPLSLGAEVDLAEAPLVPPPEAQQISALLTTPTGYLALWTDARESFGVVPAPPLRTYFARLGLDGRVVDGTGVVLPATLPAFSPASLAGACEPGGTCQLIASDQASRAILGIRISGTQVLDATPRVLLDTGSVIERFSIAWDGSAYRVVWRDILADTVRTASLALDGTLGAPVAVASPANTAGVACQQPGCLITYARGSGIPSLLRGRLVDAAGALGPELTVFQPGGRSFAGAPHWTGQHYWIGVTSNQLTNQSQFGASVRAVRVAPDGTVLDPDGIQLAAADPLVSTFPPRIGHDGTTATAIWGSITNNGQQAVRIARVSDAGAVLDPGGAPFATTSPITFDVSTGPLVRIGCHPEAEAGARSCFAAWTLTVYEDQRVVGTRFAGATELDPGDVLVATAPPGGTAAAITHAFGRYVAVWRDSRDASSDPRISPIRGAVFGTALTPITPLELGAPPQPDPICREQELPAIAASSSVHMVVWQEGCSTYNENLYGQILDGEARVAGPPFVVDDSDGKETHPSVASDGTGFFAVWDNAAAPIEIQGRRFTAAGAPIGGPITLTPSGHIPVVAFDGANYLVVWRRTVSGQRDLFAARVSPAGARLGPELAIAQTTAGEEGQSVACGGGVCLVAWRSARVRAVRIALDGTNLDPTPIDLGSGTVFATSVAWDGSAFVVTWRSGAQQRFQRVSATGALLPTTNPAFTPATTADRPALASNGAGHLALLYDRFDPTPAFRVRRVRAVAIVDDDAPPPVDAGVDAPPPVDAAIDAAIDAPPVDLDAGIDAPPPVDAAIDAPPPVDAAIDAAAVDAAAPRVDAGPTVDAGGDGGGGGGCSTAPAPGLLGWLLGAAGLAARRRRRR